MAEYTKVMEEYRRMCDYYGGACDSCRLDRESCKNILHNDPKYVESVVMTWAHEHPAPPPPIYPTIGEVVREILRLMNINPNVNLNTVYDERLTKEVADKFNIKPINKNRFINILD